MCSTCACVCVHIYISACVYMNIISIFFYLINVFSSFKTFHYIISFVSLKRKITFKKHKSSLWNKTHQDLVKQIKYLTFFSPLISLVIFSFLFYFKKNAHSHTETHTLIQKHTQCHNSHHHPTQRMHAYCKAATSRLAITANVEARLMEPADAHTPYPRLCNGPTGCSTSVRMQMALAMAWWM